MSSSADSNDGAIGQNDLETQDVMPGHTVFQAARAACIGCNVSTDRAVLQARRIRWIKEPTISHLALQIARNHARLDDGHAVRDRDLFDPVHSGQREGDPTLYGNAPAHISVPGPACGDRNLPLVCEAKQVAIPVRCTSVRPPRRANDWQTIYPGCFLPA